MCPLRFLFRVHDTQTDAHTPYSLTKGFTSGTCKASGFPTDLVSAEIDHTQLTAVLDDFRRGHSNPIGSIHYRCQAWSATRIPLKHHSGSISTSASTLTFEAAERHVGTYKYRSTQPSPFVSTSASFEYACWEANRRQSWSLRDLQISVIDYQKVQARTFRASLPLECHPDPSETQNSLINFAKAFEEHFVIGSIPADAVVATVPWRDEFVAALPAWFRDEEGHEPTLLRPSSGQRAGYRDFQREWKQAAGRVGPRSKRISAPEAIHQSFDSARYILTWAAGDNTSDILDSDLARVLYGLRHDASRFDELRCVMK
jgi:hypothetical protein